MHNKPLWFLKIYSVAMGVVLVFLGVGYGFAIRVRCETILPSIRDNPIFDYAPIYSSLPYVPLILSVGIFCYNRRIALWLLIASMALSFASIVFLAAAWKLFFSESDSLFKHVFWTVFAGGGPLIGILSLILLFPIFLKCKNA